MHTHDHEIRVNASGVYIEADVSIPADSTGVVLFVHGSGITRHSPRNQFIATGLRAHGLGTVLMDLLTPAEERADQFTGQIRFDVAFLARRVSAALDEIRELTKLPLGLFGASTGAATALIVAAGRFANISAIVSRGGRPDLAGDALSAVTAPTLLIVGSDDREVLEFNRRAMARMNADVSLEIVQGASHLFHEAGALEMVTQLAGAWFRKHSSETT